MPKIVTRILWFRSGLVGISHLTSLFLESDITANGGVVETMDTLVIGATFSLSLRVDTKATGLGDAAAENHIDLDL